MIGRLTGNILEARPNEVLLDVCGVGYKLQIPLSTYYRLGPPGAGSVALHVHTHVREDAIQLFGFATPDERAVFERMIAISGIGPKIALAVLSGMGVADLRAAVVDGHRALLEKIPGIGRKTAERMILELRDGWRPRGSAGRREAAEDPGGVVADGGSGVIGDAISALEHLGYSEVAASDAVARARRDIAPDAPVEDLLRASLRALVR